MANDTVVRIRKINNGFVICATDPAIVEENRKPSKPGGKYTPYRDPQVEYSFKTFEEVLKWLKDHKDTLIPAPDAASEYATSFDEACDD